jgi:hypothetical protein
MRDEFRSTLDKELEKLTSFVENTVNKTSQERYSLVDKYD